MPSVDLLVETEVSTSVRARQVQASFDVPERKREQLRWQLEMPIEAKPWGVGLIVGPSGSGKSSIMRHVFGAERPMTWAAKSVIDDFSPALTVEKITEACGAVGFNTIPAWLRPFHVLSNGEKFRVELARRLLEHEAPVVIDEFTSLVDRQVAKVASHSAQKFARRVGKQLVAVTCHYDVEDWLQPDWVLDASTRSFTWRALQRRPAVDVELRRVDYDVWHVFAPFHYLTADLHRAAKCFALHVAGRPVSFAAVLPFPHPRVRDIMRISRHVTLPDWQGIGLGMALVERLGGAYAALGKRLRHYPAHRALIRSLQRGPWRQVKNAGEFLTNLNSQSEINERSAFGGRPCATFEFDGLAWGDRLEASALLLGDAS
jgi:ABC-type lipoprotein export system ATPase subunit/GNAT superfamily N-acetyltransferase